MGREARSADRWRQMSSSYHTAAERRGGGDGDGEDGDESPPPPSPPPSAMRRAVRRVGALALGVVGLLYVVGLTGARFDDDDDGRDGRDAVARAGVRDEAARVTATATATATATHPRVAFVAQKPSVQKTG